MSFLRPEAVAAVRRWALPLGLAAVGLAMAVIWLPRLLGGNWLALVPLGIAALVLMTAAALAQSALAGLWARFGGPGLVTIEEGRISYFGPTGGAILALDGLDLVQIVVGGDVPGGRAWRLADAFGQHAVIPAGANGAAKLLDSLGTLPGFEVVHAIAAMQRARPGSEDIWRRPDPSTRRLG
ncbi:MAG: hypothetical protein AAF409_11410 [Pseudomonadota bacterium]